MIGYYILIGVIALVSWLVSNQLKKKFKKYAQVHLRNGLTGREIAEKMLADNGITDVEVISTAGQLTDHYNPKNKTVNLSEVVYNHANAAAAAVAAHECGHAVQHAQAYSALGMRSALVPIVSVTSGMSQWLVIRGFVLVFMGFATLFSFITLPVEYDASNRALAWLKNKNMLTQEEYAGSEDALKWAARTYLVAAIGALASLLYWALQVFGGRD